jgi:hypothetical protein
VALPRQIKAEKASFGAIREKTYRERTHSWPAAPLLQANKPSPWRLFLRYNSVRMPATDENESKHSSRRYPALWHTIPSSGFDGAFSRVLVVSDQVYQGLPDGSAISMPAFPKDRWLRSYRRMCHAPIIPVRSCPSR